MTTPEDVQPIDEVAELWQVYGHEQASGTPAQKAAHDAMFKLLQVRQLHARQPVPPGEQWRGMPGHCDACDGPWPCGTARLVYTLTEPGDTDL